MAEGLVAKRFVAQGLVAKGLVAKGRLVAKEFWRNCERFEE